MIDKLCDGVIATINGGSSSTLWHQRIGHISEKGMKVLISYGEILKLDIT